MDIQAIGSRAFSVYIAGDELARCHLDPMGMTASQARQIVGPLIDCGALDSVSLELYPGRHEVLIFVKRSSGEPEFFRFPDIESLLDALAQIDAGLVSSLFFYNGSYILAVWPADDVRAGALAEFGESLDLPGVYLLHLREHALLLCDGDAASRLREAFFGPVS